ncbi:LuxR C-terminal-related transcriptional regulator [Litoribacillus peritrichatus]|uniref:HTH luxR-type domain-containing protein n=1 Tax=Litoribacillus peritrichatus TaxID=718191 RepID=A0ABP7MSA0_9GAMM
MFNPITRSHLLKKLDGCRKVPLTIILAPAGSGKTTLLNQWQDANETLNVARLDLEIRDKAPMAFFRRFVDEVKKHSPMLDISTFNVFSNDLSCPASMLCDALMLALDSVDDELFIVLDDFQCADSPLVQQVMASLINQLPSNIHLVLASRNYPGFSLSRLKLSDALLQIEGEDLRINDQQLNLLNESHGGKTLSKPCLTRILELTEGWAVGVRIALLACKHSGESALDSFTGTLPELVDYFGYVVLNGLPASVRSLLVQSAVFEYFDVDLWEAVLGSNASGPVMNKLLAQGVFIVRTEPCNQSSREFYRYHGLLHDFLAVRLASEQTVTDIQKLHRKAADAWLVKNQMTQVIYHASRAGDNDFYLALLKDVCRSCLAKGRLSEVIHFLSEMSDEALSSEQELFEAMVFALIFSRRFNQAQYYLDYWQNLRAGNKSNHAKNRFSAVLEFLSLSLNVFLNDEDYVSADRLGQIARSTTQKDVRAFSLVIVAYYQLQRGRLEDALNTATKAKVILSHLGVPYLASYADLIIALCDRYMGRGMMAVNYISALYQGIEAQTEQPSWVNIATGMIVVYYERNQLDASQAMCERLLPKVNYACATEVVATVYLSLARLLFIKGDVQKSVRLLDRLDRILILGKYPRFKGQVAQELMRQALVQGSLDGAERIAESYDLHNFYQQTAWSEVQDYSEGRERFGLAISYLFQLQGKHTQANALLNDIHRVADTQQVKARALIAECNRIVVLYKNNAKEVAVNLLKRQLDLLGLEVFSRCIFDEAPGLGEVFACAERLNIVHLPGFYKEYFNDVFPSQVEVNNDISLSLLTKKEREIYELLVAGLSNSKISDQLSIALSTTKWHLKNIYAKLGVDNRTSAIVIARKVV